MNYLAVVGAGLVAFALGFVWSSPILFGDIWTESCGAADAATPLLKVFIAPVRELSVAYGLAQLIVRLTISGWYGAGGPTFHRHGESR